MIISTLNSEFIIQNSALFVNFQSVSILRHGTVCGIGTEVSARYV